MPGDATGPARRFGTVLFSARDPGAARAILPIIAEAKARAAFEIAIVAQGPAIGILAEADQPIISIHDAPVSHPEAPERAEIIQAARRVLLEARPELVITGLSGPGLGIDEALWVAARDCPVWCVQDLDGLVLPGFGITPELYLVSSPEAAALTQTRTTSDVVAVGSLKHSSYARLDPSHDRSRAQAELNLGGRRLVVYFGQPAWHLQGYSRTVRDLGRTLAKIAAPLVVHYRPHPKETDSERRLTMDFLSGPTWQTRLDRLPTAETALAAADLACVAYSSCGIDHAFLLRQAKMPLGCAVFLMHQADIAETFLRECGQTYPWHAERGIAQLVTAHNADAEGRAVILAQALTESARLECWTRARQYLPPSDKAPANAVERIGDLLERRRMNTVGHTTMCENAPTLDLLKE